MTSVSTCHLLVIFLPWMAALLNLHIIRCDIITIEFVMSQVLYMNQCTIQDEVVQ